MTTPTYTNSTDDDFGFDEFLDPNDPADFALDDPADEEEPAPDPDDAQRAIGSAIYAAVANDDTYDPEVDIANFAAVGVHLDRALISQAASLIARNSGDDDVALAVEEWLAEWEEEWPTPASGLVVPVSGVNALSTATGATINQMVTAATGVPLATIMPPAAAGPILPGSQFGRQTHHGGQAYDDDDELSNPSTGFAVTFTEDLIGQAKTPEEAAKAFAEALKKQELFVDVLDFTNNTRTQQIIDNPLYYETDGSQPLTEQAVSITMIAGDMELFSGETELEDVPTALERVKEAIAALSAVADTLEMIVHEAAGGPGQRVQIGRDTFAVEEVTKWVNADHQRVIEAIANHVTTPDADGTLPAVFDAALAAAAATFATYNAASAVPKSGELKTLGIKPGNIMTRTRQGKGWRITNLGPNPRPQLPGGGTLVNEETGEVIG